MRKSAMAMSVLLATALSACGTSQDMSSLLVSPGKYDIYTCDQIADRMPVVQANIDKLEALMARASQDAGGQLVNNIAYEPDYLTSRGEMRELQKSAAAKNCTNLPTGSPGSRASDNIVR